MDDKKIEVESADFLDNGGVILHEDDLLDDDELESEESQNEEH